MTRPLVLVHGAWHSGAELAASAAPLRAAGYAVHLPTLAGNRPQDARTGGLTEAIASLLEYIDAHALDDIVLVGHSYAGMVITACADRLGGRVRRLVYWNAFVPRDGEALVDLVPAHYRTLFESLVDDGGGVMLPWPVWREAFMNDADAALAATCYERLNRQPWRTFTEPVALVHDPAELGCAKSYVNATEDTALPHGMPWHPRLSERLGLFRLVQVTGGHELCFTAPARLAAAILDAARD